MRNNDESFSYQNIQLNYFEVELASIQQKKDRGLENLVEHVIRRMGDRKDMYFFNAVVKILDCQVWEA